MPARQKINRGLVSLFFRSVLVAAGPVLRLAAADPSPEPKTHTLFMGVDLDIQQKKEFFRVLDVSGGSFVIKVGDHNVDVPMDRGKTAMKVIRELKLTESSATIADLKGERAYTPENDPVKRFSKQQMGSSGQAIADNAQANWNLAISYVGAAERVQDYYNKIGLGGSEGNSAVAAATENVNTTALIHQNAQFNAGRGLNNIGVMVDKMQGELDKKLFDAMEVTFRVSSPHPLHYPYIVIVAQYREQDEKPGVAHNWIFASQLDPINNEPRRIRILRGGLPPGFELEKFQVHLYDHGNEIATNVADKRVPLTKDEAFEYVLIDYLGNHKGATLPPAPAMGRLPPGFIPGWSIVASSPPTL